jgi:hypothetical protein
MGAWVSETNYPRIRVNAPSVPKIRVRVLPALLPLQAELRNTATELQWRLGERPWVDLIGVDEISASVSLGTVTTLPPGSQATATNVGDDRHAILNFGIPAGANGTNGSGAGTVTSVSVASANGFTGTVATATTTPAITLGTSVTGLLRGNGSAISAAVAGSDYYAPGTTDVSISDGGTGASTAAGARTNLGLVIGTNVQAYNARLSDVAGITYSQGDLLYYNGTSLVKLAAGTSGQVLRTNGAGANPSWATPASTALGPHVILEDQKPSGTGGGTFTTGADRTRDITTEVYDPNGYCALASNQFTLGTGTWYIAWSAPALQVSVHQSLLYNVTAASNVARGSVEQTVASDTVTTRSVGSSVVTVASSATFQIRHRSTGTSPNAGGFGQPGFLGTEVYTRVEITKLA